MKTKNVQLKKLHNFGLHANLQLHSGNRKTRVAKTKHSSGPTSKHKPGLQSLGIIAAFRASFARDGKGRTLHIGRSM